MRRPVLCLTITGGRLRAELLRRGQVAWQAEAEYTDAGDLPLAIAQLATESMPRRPRCVRVLLDRPLVQVRTLDDLPPVGRRDLDTLVANQAGRFFRKNGKPLVTTAVWLGGVRRSRGRRPARAAAVEVHWLDAVIAGVEALGWPLERITPTESCGAALQFRRPGDLAREQRRARTQLGWLAAAAVLLWAVVGAVAIHRVTRRLNHVNSELQALDRPLAAVSRARREVGEVDAALSVIRAEAAAREVVARSIAAVAVALPDSAFLTSLEVTGSGGGGRLSGLATRAVGVTAGLQKSALVESPRLDGAVTDEAAAGRRWERFTVRFGHEVQP